MNSSHPTKFFQKVFCASALILAHPAIAQEEDKLRRYDPYAKVPEHCLSILGEQRYGLPYELNYSLTSRRARVGKSDYWLLDAEGKQQVVMVKLNREIGECEVKQTLDITGAWSLSKDASVLFGAQVDGEGKLKYGCFTMKTNHRKWSFRSDKTILTSTFSHHQKHILVVLGTPHFTNSKGEAKPIWVVWLDKETGEERRRIELGEAGRLVPYEFQRGTIEDTQYGTFVCKNGEKGSSLYHIAPKGDVVKRLFEGREGFESRDEPAFRNGGEGGPRHWMVRAQPGEGKWVAFFHGQKMHLFSNGEEGLKDAQSMVAGKEDYFNDDIINVIFSEEGDRLVVGSLLQTTIINLKNLEKIEKRLDWGTATSDFTADGKYLVFWGRGGASLVSTMNWKSAREERQKTEAFHCCPISSLAFSPSGKYLSTGDDHRFLVWSVSDAKLRSQLISRKGTDDCLLRSPAWGVDDAIFYGTDGFDVLEWNLKGGGANTKQMKGKVAFGGVESRVKKRVLDIAIDSKGENIVVIDNKTAVYRKAKAPSASRTLELDNENLGSSRRAILVDGENNRLLIATSIDLQDVDLEGKRATIRTVDPRNYRIFRGNTGEVVTKEGPHEREMFTSRSFKDGSIVSSFPVKGDSMFFGKYCTSADGEILAYIFKDEIHLLNWADKKVYRKIAIPASMTSMALSADGKILATGSSNRAIYLWNAAE